MAQIQPQTTSESFLYVTLRLDLVLNDGNIAVGTGFVYNHQTPENRTFPILMTNRHVIADSQSLKVKFHRLDPSVPGWTVSGYVDLTLPLSETAWTGHPDPAIDLAGIPLRVFQEPALAQGKELAIRGFEAPHIPDDLSVFDAIEDIIMIGYPSGCWDSVNNYPLLRRGITASHPGIDFDGRPDIAIDMACFHGSSGSPVLLPYSSSRIKPVPFFSPSRLFAFLGVLYAGPLHLIEGRVVVPAPALISTVANIPMNLGYVIKAREVAKLAAHIATSIPTPS